MRTSRSLSQALALVGVALWIATFGTPALLAQGTIGLAQKDGDNERKFIANLERSDLEPRGLLVLRIEGEAITVADHRFDGLQQLALETVDFDGTQYSATALQPSDARDPFSGRQFVGVLPQLERAKKVRLRFDVLDRDAGVERRDKVLCKLDHPLPLSGQVLEIYVVAGSTRDFWCRDVVVDPADLATEPAAAP